jgi:peptidoglycan hydrolase FlgJ
MNTIASGAASAPLAASEEARLRQAAKDLEGVFVGELFKAMRETIPEGGLTDGGMGEEMFTSMLDQHIAPQVSRSWQRSIGDALYQQLRGALNTQAAPETGTE